MSQAVEIEADEAAPLALEDDHRAAVVPAPEFADLVAGRVDHAELVFLGGVDRGVEVDDDVQVFLRTGLDLGGRAGPGDVVPADVGRQIVDVPLQASHRTTTTRRGPRAICRISLPSLLEKNLPRHAETRSRGYILYIP